MILSKGNELLLHNKAMRYMDGIAVTHCAPLVGGGFVRAHYANEEPSDMDLFFRTQDQAEAMCNAIDHAEGWERVIMTDNATTFEHSGGKSIQVVHAIYGTPTEIVRGFDFTMCQAVFDVNHTVTYFDSRFFPDIASRKLVYTGSDYPLSSLRRAIKFIGRGYRIDMQDLVAIAVDISRKGIHADAEVLRDQLLGVDLALLGVALDSEYEREDILASAIKRRELDTVKVIGPDPFTEDDAEPTEE